MVQPPLGKGIPSRVGNDRAKLSTASTSFAPNTVYTQDEVVSLHRTANSHRLNTTYAKPISLSMRAKGSGKVDSAPVTAVCRSTQETVNVIRCSVARGASAPRPRYR